MKKLIIAVFVLSLVALPSTTRAGFFDFFRTNQSAQVKTAVKSDNLILQVQQALTSQGFYKGDLSGVVGAKTKTAIKSFQKMNKLPVTGLLDQATVNEILKSGGGVVGCMDPASINYNPLATIPGPCTFGGGSANVSYPSRICNETTGPWIKVLSPNGGEVFTAGQQIDITWSTCSIDNPVQILLMKINPDLDFQPNGTITSLVGNTTANDGNETVTLPTFGLNGDEDFWYSGQQEYRIMITELGDGGPGVFLPKDFSNENFTIGDAVTGNCDVTTEEFHPFVSSIPITNGTLFSGSWTNEYTEMSIFRIQNPSNCPMSIPKIAVVIASTDGLQFVEKEDLRLKTLDDGNMYTPTNVGINYPNSNASFTILDTIPANSYKDYGVGTVDLHYFDPYSMQANLNLGGVVVGIGQVDFEIGGLALPVWNSNTVLPSTIGPVWGSVVNVLQ